MSRSRARVLWAALQGAAAIVSACRGPALAAGDGGAPVGGAVTVVVTSVTTSRESAMYTSVKAEFRNSSSTPVTVRSYAIDWPEGRFVASDVGMDLAPGAVQTRTARVGPNCGRLDRLTMGSARVSVVDVR